MEKPKTKTAPFRVTENTDLLVERVWMDLKKVGDGLKKAHVYDAIFGAGIKPYLKEKGLFKVLEELEEAEKLNGLDVEAA